MMTTRKYSHRGDRFPHLPTVLAQNDPFLRRLYGAVSFIIDDHPYPTTQEEFQRRDGEIRWKLRALNLNPGQQKFLRRLETETSVSLVGLLRTVIPP